MLISKYTHLIKSKSQELGFGNCRISKADFLEEEASRLEKWISKEYHGGMGYMENHFEKRVDPRLLVDGAQSVISLTYNYYTSKRQYFKESPKISMYAYGKDYHKVVRKKLKQLFNYLKEEIGNINGRFFVDSAPILEKVWAEKSGVGWIGKNTNLISRNMGSYFFLAELILDIPLEYDTPLKDYCGTCTKCIDSCPTEAIVEPYLLDGSKCISYFTIELKEHIPNHMKGKFENWMFGCDICQEVCPWNKFSKENTESDFIPKEEILSFKKSDWDKIEEEDFNRIFQSSPLKRSGFKGVKRNLEFLKKSCQKPLE